MFKPNPTARNLNPKTLRRNRECGHVGRLLPLPLAHVLLLLLLRVDLLV